MYEVYMPGLPMPLHVTRPGGLLTAFEAASLALRVAGTVFDNGTILVLGPLEEVETFEFTGVDGIYAIV